MDANEFTTGPLTLDEMMKILSLLENPPEADGVRKALRFYEMPARRDYSWGKLHEMMKMLEGYACPQKKSELDRMIKLVAGSKAVLEIGSSFGGTLKHMASVLPRGCTVVAVDLPWDETPRFLNAMPSLKEVCRQLGILGANVQLIIGDSHLKSVVERVSEYGPYDFVFIDGDNSYEGRKADWENYGPMGRMVGIHGIVESRLWDEIKASGAHMEEFIEGADAGTGIGIVYRE